MLTVNLSVIAPIASTVHRRKDKTNLLVFFGEIKKHSADFPKIAWQNLTYIGYI